MKNIIKKVASIAALSILTTQPAYACWDSVGQSALKIKHLNMMLMATALRCRKTSDNFLPYYNAFVTRHNSYIGSQNAIVKAELSQTLGPKGAVSASDELTVGFANKYGAGHPDMDCGALKMLAARLSAAGSSSKTLNDEADRVLVKTTVPGKTCRVSSTVIAQK
jgi:hypothetical protein